MAMIEGLEWEHQGAFLTNELFFDAQRLQQMGVAPHGEGQRRYLDSTAAGCTKQDLEKSQEKLGLQDSLLHSEPGSL